MSKQKMLLIERESNGRFKVARPVEVYETPRKRRAYLSDWSLVSTADGSKWVRLQGFVFGHPKFQNGDFIKTSPVLKLNIPEGYAETMNTQYMLRDDRHEY